VPRTGSGAVRRGSGVSRQATRPPTPAASAAPVVPEQRPTQRPVQQPAQRPAQRPGRRAAPAPVPTAGDEAAARRGRAPRAPFVLLVVGLLCGGLVSLLLLNTVLAQDSFDANQLRADTQEIQQEKERLQQLIARNDQPARLAEEAPALGVKEDWDHPNVIEVGGAGNDTGSSTEPARGAQDPVAGRTEDRVEDAQR
jgi:hypothetical protein